MHLYEQVFYMRLIACVEKNLWKAAILSSVSKRLRPRQENHPLKVDIVLYVIAFDERFLLRSIALVVVSEQM